jgi:phosphatidate cytidylyltransferase
MPGGELTRGPNLPLLIILAVWINDTMAYLVGSFIGKTPFSKISPKKTWEGTIGGIILCVAVIGFVANSKYSAILGIPAASLLPGYHWFVIAGLVAVAGTAGDLFESKLKRQAGIKDSGSIMPGHGGFLDRFDSLLFATPLVWLYVTLFM